MKYTSLSSSAASGLAAAVVALGLAGPAAAADMIGNCEVTGKKAEYQIKPAVAGQLTVEVSLPAPGWWNGDTPEAIKDGYEYCMAANIAYRAGLPKVAVVNVAWAQLIGGNTNNYDLALSEASITEDFGAGTESRTLSCMSRLSSLLPGLFPGHVRDLNLAGVAFRFDLDRDHVPAIVGNDGALILIRIRGHGVGESCFVEATDLVERVVALEDGGYGVNAAKGCGRCAVLLDFRSGIDIHPEILGGLLGILGTFERAERSFGFYMIALLTHVRALGDAIDEEAEGSNTNDAEDDDHGDHDEDDFEGAAAAGGVGNRRMGRCSHDGNRGGGSDGGAALIAELGSVT